MKEVKPNTNRIPRVNSLIQQKLGEILRDYLDDEQGLTTISKVETTRDLKHAKVWLSIFNGKDERILDKINKNIYDIQGQLNSAMNTKIFPRLSFHLDTSPRYVAHIDELIKKVHEEE